MSVPHTHYTSGGLMMVQLSWSLLLCCTFGYLPLKYWKTTPAYLLAFFVVGCMFLAALLCTLNPVMGITYDRSRDFKRSWIKGLALRKGAQGLDGIQQLYLKLKCCYPFGFTCGHFFIIRTFTMLTCFSASSTYIIIMLQFGV
jgi:hypothetical protein